MQPLGISRSNAMMCNPSSGRLAEGIRLGSKWRPFGARSCGSASHALRGGLQHSALRAGALPVLHGAVALLKVFAFSRRRGIWCCFACPRRNDSADWGTEPLAPAAEAIPVLVELDVDGFAFHAAKAVEQG